MTLWYDHMIINNIWSQLFCYLVPGWKYCMLHFHERQRESILISLRNQICQDGQRKGFVNIKHHLDLLINTMSETLHFFTSHPQRKTARLFQFFTSLTLWRHGLLHQPALQQKPLYQSPFMHLSAIYSALAMKAILYSYGRGANLYSVTKLWCLPTDKLALSVTSNGRRGKKTKPKCFLIGPLGNRAKSAASVERV